MFDFTISVSHLITLAGFAAAFAWNWFTLKSKTDKALEQAEKAKAQFGSLSSRSQSQS